MAHEVPSSPVFLHFLKDECVYACVQNLFIYINNNFQDP